MTRNRRSNSDDGTPSDALFASFPDPLLAYTSEGADDPRRDPAATGRPPVVRAVNPAFETTFGVGADEALGTPLDELALPGARLFDAGDSTSADAAVDDTTVDAAVAPDASVAIDTRSRDGDDADPTDHADATSVGAIHARVREETDTAVYLRHGTGEEARHFRVRVVVAGLDVDNEDGRDGVDGEDGGDSEGGGYLLFTDVTDVERRRRELETTVTRLERLASVASHDIRNPLEVAEIRLEAARDTGEAVHFEKVAGALDRIETIVRDVLSVGGGVDPTDVVALADVATAAWDTVDTADATLVTAEGLPTVRGDADRLQHLFENLFRNCVEHGSTNNRAAPQSGNSLEHGSTGSRTESDDAVEHGGSEVTVTVEPIPEGFAVVDDGPGVPPEVRDRVFEAGVSAGSDGGGLGLSIVARIAREHGWRVSLGPEPNDGGARFEFTGVERIERAEETRETDGVPGSNRPGESGQSDESG